MTIRRTPEDFVVEERLAARVTSAWAGAGEGAGGTGGAGSAATPAAVYALRKNSLTTPEGVHWLAKALGVRDGAVSYAGLKDKHAVTTQHVSVRVADAKQRGAMPAEVSGTNGHGWSARLVGWSAADLTAEAIEANEFTIVVRDLTREGIRVMNQRVRALGWGGDAAGVAAGVAARVAAGAAGTAYVVNYFGDQRFGSARHGAGWIAAHLVRGEFEAALRLAIATPARKETGTKRAFTRIAASQWPVAVAGGGVNGAEGKGGWERLRDALPRCAERRAVEVLAAGGTFREAFAALPAFTQQISVEAYQSYLWNEMVRREVTRRVGGRGGIVAADTFGELVFLPAGSVRAEDAAETVALPSPGAVYEGAWGAAAEGVWRDAGLTLGEGGLEIPGLRRPVFGEASRPWLARVEGLEIGAAEPDELSKGWGGGSGGRHKRRVRFALPRGAYATVVLRALGC